MVSAIVTFVLGFYVKKHPKFNNKLIPVQNLLIGIISAIIYYLYTEDFSLVIAGVGLFAGGTYDIFNNLNKIINEKKEA